MCGNKHKEEWEEHYEFSRELNGIYATLEICDRSMVKISWNVWLIKTTRICRSKPCSATNSASALKIRFCQFR